MFSPSVQGVVLFCWLHATILPISAQIRGNTVHCAVFPVGSRESI